MSLTTEVGTVKLETPLLLASGYITETPDFFLQSKGYGCAGMVTRSLKRRVPPERARITAPRYAVFGEESMLNGEWGNERPWTEWRDGGVQRVKETGSALILSLSGREIESCAELIASFDAIGVDAFEINISCSHSGVLHGSLNADEMHLRELLKRIRRLTTTPIWIKLSYSHSLVAMGKAAEEGGADAIVCTNSIGPGMLIDTKTGKPKLGIEGGGGGVTGKAIFPIALWCVHQLSRTLHIPIVGSGGVTTADEAIQMLMAGAQAIELYTAPALLGPLAFRRILSGMQRFLAERGDPDIRSLIGWTIGKTDTHVFSAPRPVVIEERCTGCEVCLRACAFDALIMADRPGLTQKLAVILPNCIACNACVGVCPPKFDAIRAIY